MITELHEEYFRVIEADGKPEKGERKIADELVLLINEILEERALPQADEWTLYRIGVLEFALEKSPYNFDIQLSLVKIYDSHGWSTSFNHHFNGLGLKAVQLESLGYYLLRHAVDFGEVSQMRSFSLKYGKYCKLNAQNLKSCKMKALTDLNFD